MLEECPVCGNGYLSNYTEKIKVEYKGHSCMIDTLYSVCDGCFSEQANASQTRHNKEQVKTFKYNVDSKLCQKPEGEINGILDSGI